MRLMLGGGGSGGHVFPALAVAAALRERIGEELELLYLGTAQGVEATIVPEQGIAFEPIEARGLRGRNPLGQAWSLALIGNGLAQAVRLIRRFRPQAILVTGGYVSVPVGLAARLTRTPLVLFQPDIEPGWAVQLLARLATRICVTDARSLQRLPARKARATGYPLRPVFREIDRPMARAHFDLNGGPALLVAGAVQGAHSLNEAIATDLERWIDIAQVIHVTGPADARRLADRRETLPPDRRHRYHVYEYLGEDLPAAMAACDLAISRAGASILGEYPAAKLPAVLVPLPGAGGHQRRNAQVLADAGAAIVIEQADLAADLFPTVEALLRDTTRLAAMRQSVAAKAKPDAAAAVAEVVWEVRRG